MIRAIHFTAAFAAILVATAGQVRAEFMTFEDVPGGSLQNKSGEVGRYRGYNFSRNLDWIDLDGNTWPYGAHGGEFAILNSDTGVGLISKVDGTDFVFEGLWAKKWLTSPESGGLDSLSGVLQGYNNGTQVWSVPTSLNGSYRFYEAQGGAIDELRLGLGNFFLVDDITLNPATVAIPEPSSLTLLGTGLVALCIGATRHRRRQSDSIVA
ncbi:PEP-CTERM sorting domain-containing protein [Aureliella helgolandensis]|uniref:PEP-CTERM motif protein n=1 Tax=Aureliella helgolandensis TaxID=2527968 RepID=A0A518G443_9BACT|nr:PEP-CTERM sorting domain-containing protein [Aureliella helgolandensis]QDV23345.1 PEP-CTERM motif protein [Aureliella helgolandensis]